MSRFIIVNGKVKEKDDVNLTHLFWSDAFSISRKIWFGFGGIPLFSENITALSKQLEALKLPFPELLNNPRELFRITKRMLNKNRFYRSGIIYFQLFWVDKQLTTVISSFAFTDFDFPFSNQGLLLNYSEFRKNSQLQLTRFSFYNTAHWKLTEAQLVDLHFHNSIILNENNSICECINANIFMIKKNVILTPSLRTGCYEDILRNTVLNISSQLHFKIMELENLKKTDLLQMDEIFLVSEEKGIEWVLGVENKRFVHRHSIKIHEKLNELLKDKVN